MSHPFQIRVKLAFYLSIAVMALAAQPARPNQFRRHERHGFGAGSIESTDQKNRYLITIAADGTGDTKTLQEAIDRVPENNTQRFVLHLRPGTYNTQIKISQTKPFITLQGEDPLRTVVTFNNSAKTSGATSRSYTAFIGGSDFRAENVTFENTYGVGSQAVAAFVNTDRAIFRNCRFLGWQDTLYAHGGRQYYKDCYIEGHVDFIFGNGTVVFENCAIHSKGQGYVTAHYRLSDAETNGYVFLKCKLTGANTDKGVYLGRPWRAYGRVVFIDCWLGAHIRPEGWDNWRDPEREKTARFAEHNSRGPGANPGARVAWSKQLNDEEIRQFATKTFLRGVDNWNPTRW
jgi:pectinesterase